MIATPTSTSSAPINGSTLKTCTIKYGSTNAPVNLAGFSAATKDWSCYPKAGTDNYVFSIPTNAVNIKATLGSVFVRHCCGKLWFNNNVIFEDSVCKREGDSRKCACGVYDPANTCHNPAVPGDWDGHWEYFYDTLGNPMTKDISSFVVLGTNVITGEVANACGGSTEIKSNIMVTYDASSC